MRTFLLGVAATIPVIAIGLPLSLLQPPPVLPIRAAFFAAFVTAAIPEEFLKFLVLVGYSARRRCFDEPMDGLVYGAAAALGFAALENVLYVMDGGWATALLRAVTAVPMHAAAGAMIGYGISMARFGSRGRSAIWEGFLAAVAVHGTYDFALFGLATIPEASRTPEAWILILFAIAVVTLVGSVAWTIRTSRRLRRAQLPG
jgi:RsiW-degrading membrane proteinase PrsW (M82 family)